MNTKLDIVRFECDDVIATSGEFCSAGKNVDHYRIDGDRYNNGNYPCTYFGFLEEGDWAKGADVASENMFASGVEKINGWYYIFDNGKIVKCNGDHNPDVAKEYN